MFNNKIDLHSHFLPPAYYEYLKKYEDEYPDNFEIPDWSEDGHIKWMDQLGVAFSLITSLRKEYCLGLMEIRCSSSASQFTELRKRSPLPPF